MNITLDEIHALIENKKQRKASSVDKLEIFSLGAEIVELEKQRDELITFSNRTKAYLDNYEKENPPKTPAGRPQSFIL